MLGHQILVDTLGAQAGLNPRLDKRTKRLAHTLAPGFCLADNPATLAVPIAALKAGGRNTGTFWTSYGTGTGGRIGGTLWARLDVEPDGFSVDSELTRDATLAPSLFMQGTNRFL